MVCQMSPGDGQITLSDAGTPAGKFSRPSWMGFVRAARCHCGIGTESELIARQERSVPQCRGALSGVFALMFLICADIVARTMFDNPIAGVTEMVSMSLVATVFMQLPHAVRSGRLTRTEFLIDYLESSSPAAASGFKCLALGMRCVDIQPCCSWYMAGTCGSRCRPANSSVLRVSTP